MCHIRSYITPSFGPSITSQASGIYGPLGLDIILMEGMKETLISISQLCKGGLTGIQNVVIFTNEGMRCFTFESIRDASELIDKLGVEVMVFMYINQMKIQMTLTTIH